MVGCSLYESSAVFSEEGVTMVSKTDVDESIEIEVGFNDTILTASNSNMTESNSKCNDDVKKVERTSTIETSMDTWISRSTSEGHDYGGISGVPSVFTDYDASEYAVEDSKDECIDIVEEDATTKVRKVHLTNAKETVLEFERMLLMHPPLQTRVDPEVKRMLLTLGSMVRNRNQAIDNIRGLLDTVDSRDPDVEDSVDKSVAEEDTEKLALMVRNRNQAINNIRGLLDTVDPQAAKSQELIVNKKKQVEPDFKQIADDCIVVAETNRGSNKGSGSLNAGKTVTSSNKLAGMVRDRNIAVNNNHGLLERETETIYSAEEDFVIKLNKNVKIPKQDEGCKDQAKMEMVNIVKFLKTQNGNYAQQLGQAGRLIQRMDAMEEALAVKKVVMDQMAVDIDNKNSLLEQKTAENLDLSEQLRLSNAMIQQVVAINKEKIKRLTVLEEDVASQETVIDKMSSEVYKWNITCNEMTAGNAALNERLKVLNAESDELKTYIQYLETKNNEMTKDIKNWSTTCKGMASQNDALVDQLEEAKSERDKLKTTIGELESKNSYYFRELQNLTTSLQRLSIELMGERDVNGVAAEREGGTRTDAKELIIVTELASIPTSIMLTPTTGDGCLCIG